MSKDANLAMGIGGAVRMRGYYDWGGAVPSSAFIPYLTPMNPSPTSMKHFGTTPSGTCLFFRVLGRNKTLGDYQLYIEANFNGYNSRDFLLKKAYAIINDFTIGYASSTFSDPAAVPPTVDAAGPNNKITPTSVLVRYMRLYATAGTLQCQPKLLLTHSTWITRTPKKWITGFLTSRPSHNISGHPDNTCAWQV